MINHNVREVYYRVFSEDGPIRTLNPVYSEDPYLGRIAARLVTPPHIAINLRRCLSNAENIDSTIITRLFVSCSSQRAMDDAGRVSILAYPGLGCSPNEPMVLVAVFPHTFELPPPEMVMPLQAGVDEGSTPLESQYSKHPQGPLCYILTAISSSPLPSLSKAWCNCVKATHQRQ
jgi:hypothetical protein